MNDQNTEIVTDTSALGQIERAQIDMQIATARRYPRQLSLVKQRMLSFATLDEETAAGCFYTLPGRKGGDGKPLQGPSVRLAEIALSCYQHLRAGSRIIEDDGKFITAQGVVHDLENNVVISIEVKRRVTNKQGQRYSDDMIATTGNAACSIALRNAAFRVIPMALVKPVYEASKMLAIGDAKSLVQRRSEAMARFAKIGVTAELVFAALEVRSLEDIQLDHLETLFGYYTAIKDGDTTIDEVFSRKDERKTPEGPKANPYEEKKPEKFADLPKADPVKALAKGMTEALEEHPDNPFIRGHAEAATVAVAASEEPDEIPLEAAPSAYPSDSRFVNEKDERASLMSDIKAMLADEDSTITKYAPKCREAGLLATGVQFLDMPIADLRVIHENRLAILKGEYKAGGEA